MFRLPKVIVFDLGKVILEFSHDQMCQQVADLFAGDVAEVKKFLFATELHLAYERGQMTTQQVLDKINVRFGCDLLLQDVTQALGDIFRLNAAIVPLISGLKSAGWRTGILSNTCDAHWQCAIKKFGILSAFFDFYVLSFEVDEVKPFAGIYQSAAKAAGCLPSEIFFVDDLMENVEGAREAGIDAVLYTDVPNLVADLRRRKVRFAY